MNFNFNSSFKCNYYRQWFNDNYFISLYDNDDNNLFSFEDIDSATQFFNLPLKTFLRALRNGVIEYNNSRCKLYIFKKSKKDFIDIERGKRL